MVTTQPATWMPSSEVLALAVVLFFLIVVLFLTKKREGVFGRDKGLTERNVGKRDTVIFAKGKSGGVLYYVKEKTTLPDGRVQYKLDDRVKDHDGVEFGDGDLWALDMHNVAGGSTPIVLFTTDLMMWVADMVTKDGSVQMRFLDSRVKELESELGIYKSKVALLESDPDKFKRDVIEGAKEIIGAERQKRRAEFEAKKHGG